MRVTIRFKFALGFFIIFLISFLVLVFAISSILERGNEETITSEMETLKRTSNERIEQFLRGNFFDNDEIGFKEMSKDIARKLKTITESEVHVYSLEGQLLYNTSKTKEPEYEDLRNAITGSVSYTIKSDKNNTTVYFSYPVIILNNKVGIIRFSKDYSTLFLQSRHIKEIIIYAALIIFIIAFIFSYLLSRNISIPLLRLNNAANKVAGGNLDVNLDSKRRDEIGDLTRNFNKMVEKISAQIITIEKDRDSLLELNNYKKHFFDNVTHELKTPLTTILGYAEIIHENAFTDIEFFDSGVNHIINESKRLHSMVIRLLELSKDSFVIEDELKEIDIGNLLKDTCKGMELKARRYGNTILCKVDKNVCIYGNSDNLQQVFINIIDNAIKYGYTDSPIQVSATAKEKNVEINIINKGDGIPEKHMSQIFTPFYRVDKLKSRELGSCGLGLSISKTIIEKYKGKIEIASQPYKETTVTISLPTNYYTKHS
ncbi:HAMP domain-containing sensor histidine kinase [Clostridium sp. JS66]|uniref:HAMP domain-containing sensor histidine kinase n=1 Tax=Clostridium sp. JS66 TaxID=3064705 RepID=UPI00298EC1CB|nr:HAMP domain-containing sensor histidine kinase [Clostridium sp. JS66]WPC42539.1 HAMP domain-containing sensor histidine kinase [Clostridium sp. JS66]